MSVLNIFVNLANQVFNLLGLSHGGTNADLSATGGTSQVLKQVSSGAAITVAQLAAADLSNGTSGSGAVALVGGPTFTGEITNSNGSYGSNATTVINSSTPVTIGAIINTGLFTLRDSTNGGSALVWYGDGVFSIIAQGGGTTFVTTAPSATQIQVGYVGSPTYKLSLLAGSSRNGDTIAWSLVYNQG